MSCVLRRDRQAVDLGERAERRRRPARRSPRAAADRATPAAAARRRSGRAPAPVRRRQEIDVVARAHRPGFLRRLHVLVAHHQRELGPGRHDAAPQIRAVGDHRIADQLLLELPGRSSSVRRGADVGARQRQTPEPAPPRRWSSPGSAATASPRRRRRRNRSARRQADQHRDRGEEEPTAPRRPTQEMNSFSRKLKRNGARQSNTAAGRAISISASATASAGSAAAAAGRARPAGRAARTWRSARARWRRRGTTTTVLWARVSRLPTMSPAR